jgi:hypothetical protein
MLTSRLLHAARSASRAVPFGLRSFADSRDSRVMLTHKRGMDIIQDPDLNKVQPPCHMRAQHLTRLQRELGFPKARRTASASGA